MSLIRKITLVAEGLELLGLQLLADCTRACQSESYAAEMAHLAHLEAIKQNEIDIAIRMGEVRRMQ